MIVFTRIQFKNFLSSGNTPVTIDLNNHKTTLIHGVNGTGKSTVLDAICYALFNKPFRSINLPQLINTSNKKDLLTTIEFRIGKEEFVIERGMKPKKFNITINGEPIKAKANDKEMQDYLEQNILKMTMKSFIQVVILGTTNYQPFMQMNAAARRECVEDFLDIKVFSTMATIAKERLRGLKDQVNSIKSDISTSEYKIDIQKERIAEIAERSAADIEALKEEIVECGKTKQEHLDKITDLQARNKEIADELETLLNDNPKNKAQQYNNVIVKLESKLESLRTVYKFYNNDECPTCHQSIGPELKTEVQNKTVEESKELISAKEEASAKHDELKLIVDQVNEKEREVYKIQQEVSKYQSLIDQLQRQIQQKETKIAVLSTKTDSIDTEKGKLSVLEEQVQGLRTKNDTAVQDVHNHDIVVSLLKDSGIKTQVVRKYLPVMNKLIRKYLTDLDFPIHFMLNEEFKEEVLSPMYQDFSYGSFSEGQKSRIDLALMLTWREIGKLKNSVSVNLLILDEVFSSSLDQTGKELLFALLKYGMEDSQKILVVDHTLDTNFKEKFDHNIQVTKVKGFSKYD